MKVIKQDGYPDLEIDNREPDIIMVWQKFTERSSDVNQITREKAREYALSICPELAHLEGALLAEQDLNNQLKQEIERMKEEIEQLKSK